MQAAASASPRFSVVLSTAVAEKDLRAWFVAAQPGHSATYASGLDLPRDAAGVQLARRLSDAGQARLHQRRAAHDSRQWEWVIIKIGGDGEVEVNGLPRAHGSCCTEHPATVREMDALAELLGTIPADRKGWTTCPSNAVLARTLDLGSGANARRRARYLLDRLRSAGRIELQHSGRDSARRVRVVG